MVRARNAEPVTAGDLLAVAGEARAAAAESGNDDEATALHRKADELEAVALAVNEHDNYARSHAAQDQPAKPAEQSGE